MPAIPTKPLMWEGYDAIEQTKDVQAYIRNRRRDSQSDAPFLPRPLLGTAPRAV